MSVPSNREFHYKNLRDRYTNCTYVDGNLEITWIQNDSYDLSFLQHIREVTVSSSLALALPRHAQNWLFRLFI